MTETIAAPVASLLDEGLSAFLALDSAALSLEAAWSGWYSFCGERVHVPVNGGRSTVPAGKVSASKLAERVKGRGRSKSVGVSNVADILACARVAPLYRGGLWLRAVDGLVVKGSPMPHRMWSAATREGGKGTQERLDALVSGLIDSGALAADADPVALFDTLRDVGEVLARLGRGEGWGESTEGPTSEGPTSEGPTSEGPTSEGPTSEGPTSEGPTSEGPTSEGPTSEGPTSEGPTGGDASDMWAEHSLAVLVECIEQGYLPSAEWRNAFALAGSRILNGWKTSSGVSSDPKGDTAVVVPSFNSEAAYDRAVALGLIA